MWHVEVSQMKTYISDEEVRSYHDTVLAEFPSVGTALSYSEMTLKYMKNVKVKIWHEESNMEKGE